MRWRLLHVILLFCLVTTAYATNNENWMSSIPDHRQLNQIFIPGTHDSASARITPHSLFALIDDGYVPIWFRTLSNLFPNDLLRPIVAKWAKTQPYTVADQLKMGIRYFDLRLDYDDKLHTIYFCHNLLGATLHSQLVAINAFLRAHPSEIVILDFNHVYNVDTNKEFQLLMQRLSADLGDLMIPNTYSPSSTLHAIRQSKRQVIVFLSHPFIATDAKTNAFYWRYIWPDVGISSPWPDQSDVRHLKEVLNKEMDYHETVYRHENKFFVLQMVMTENSSQVVNAILFPMVYPDNIAAYTRGLNAVLPRWLSDFSNRYPVGSMNVVIQDWFDGRSGLVEMAKQMDSVPLTLSQGNTIDPSQLAALKRYALALKRPLKKGV